MKRITASGITVTVAAASLLLVFGAGTRANQPAGQITAVIPSAVAGRSALVFPGAGGKLVYKPWNDRGDTILDFSNCGYGGGGVALPLVPAKVTLAPASGSGDDTPRIQTAIEQVGKVSPAANGFR